jgi:hypothetical protein
MGRDSSGATAACLHLESKRKMRMSMSTDYRVSALLVGLVESKLGLFYVGLRACLDIEREVRLKHFSPFSPRLRDSLHFTISRPAITSIYLFPAGGIVHVYP